MMHGRSCAIDQDHAILNDDNINNVMVRCFIMVTHVMNDPTLVQASTSMPR